MCGQTKNREFTGSVTRDFNFWCWRRNSTDWSYNYDPTPTILDRGFTGHEHIDVFVLINMNVRMYDPLVARFLGVDPVLPIDPPRDPRIGERLDDILRAQYGESYVFSVRIGLGLSPFAGWDIGWNLGEIHR